MGGESSTRLGAVPKVVSWGDGEEGSGDCSSTIRTAVVARLKEGRGSSASTSLGIVL